MTTPTSEPTFPDQAKSIFSPSIVSGEKRIKDLKRKLDMNEEPIYVPDFESKELRKIHAASLQKDQPLDFDFGSWRQAIRHNTGHLFLKLQITKNDGSAYPATAAGMAGMNAWLREGLFHNMFSEVEVLINSTPITMQNYDHIAKCMSILQMPKERAEFERLVNDFGVGREAQVNPDPTRTAGNEIDNDLVTMTPNTLPSQITTVTDSAAVAIQEQKAYNSIKLNRILGSNEFYISGYLQHPFFGIDKFLPPSFPYRLRLKTNPPAHAFQCTSSRVPKIVIKEAYMEDALIKVESSEGVKIAQEIISKGSMLQFPVVRRVINEFNMPKGRKITINRAISGMLPTRAFITILDNAAWKTDNPVRNPYNFQFPGLTGFTMKYGDMEWPYKGGYKINNVPASAPPYTKAQTDLMVATNMDFYTKNMSVYYPKSLVHRLAVTPTDLFTHSFVLCVDLSPLGDKAENPNVRFTRFEGEITLEFEFSHELGADKSYTIALGHEYENQYAISVPDFTFNTDY